MKAFKNEWTPSVWEGVGPVLPTAVQDALTYYQQLLVMVNAINETRDNADKLALDCAIEIVKGGEVE